MPALNLGARDGPEEWNTSQQWHCPGCGSRVQGQVREARVLDDSLSIGPGIRQYWESRSPSCVAGSESRTRSACSQSLGRDGRLEINSLSIRDVEGLSSVTMIAAIAVQSEQRDQDAAALGDTNTCAPGCRPLHGPDGQTTLLAAQGPGPPRGAPSLRIPSNAAVRRARALRRRVRAVAVSATQGCAQESPSCHAGQPPAVRALRIRGRGPHDPWFLGHDRDDHVHRRHSLLAARQAVLHSHELLRAPPATESSKLSARQV